MIRAKAERLRAVCGSKSGLTEQSEGYFLNAGSRRWTLQQIGICEEKVMLLKYRKATPNDIEEIYSIVRTAIDAMERDNIFQWDDLYPAKEDFQEDGDKSQLYVGSVNGQIAVVYTLNQKCDKEYENGKWNYKDKPFYIIHRLCVNPIFQNRGIAKSTLLYIEKQLTEMGIHVIRLDVFSKNPFALRLYNSLGYSEVGYADWRKGKFFLMEKCF